MVTPGLIRQLSALASEYVLVQSNVLDVFHHIHGLLSRDYEIVSDWGGLPIPFECSEGSLKEYTKTRRTTERERRFVEGGGVPALDRTVVRCLPLEAMAETEANCLGR